MKKFYQSFIKPFLTAIGTLLSSAALAASVKLQVIEYVSQYLNAPTQETRNYVLAVAAGAFVVGVFQIITKALALTVESYNE